MSSVLRDIGRMFGRTDKQMWRDKQVREGVYFKGAAPRERVAVPPTPPLHDPVGILGHPPRGRTRRGRRR
jgi:hypothetical protein